MDSLMTNSLTGKVAEKTMDSQVGKDTCCPDLGFKTRVICFLGLYIFGALLAFIGCFGLQNSDDEDYSIGRFIVPYAAGFILAMGG